MRRMSEGEKKAVQMLAAERMCSDQIPPKVDTLSLAVYQYFLRRYGLVRPRGVWVNGKRKTIKGLHLPGFWIPYPQEVQDCCKAISPKHGNKFYGGYWGHCHGIKHMACLHGVPYRLLRQTVYYYAKIQDQRDVNGWWKTMQDVSKIKEAMC